MATPKSNMLAGTLTRNVMEFFKCSIAGVSYGTGITEIERVAAARKSQACAHASQLSKNQACQWYSDALCALLHSTAPAQQCGTPCVWRSVQHS